MDSNYELIDDETITALRRLGAVTVVDGSERITFESDSNNPAIWFDVPARAFVREGHYMPPGAFERQHACLLEDAHFVARHGWAEYRRISVEAG